MLIFTERSGRHFMIALYDFGHVIIRCGNDVGYFAIFLARFFIAIPNVIRRVFVELFNINTLTL
jgi:hypothetical protein